MLFLVYPPIAYRPGLRGDVQGYVVMYRVILTTDIYCISVACHKCLIGGGHSSGTSTSQENLWSRDPSVYSKMTIKQSRNNRKNVPHYSLWELRKQPVIFYKDKLVFLQRNFQLWKFYNLHATFTPIVVRDCDFYMTLSCHVAGFYPDVSSQEDGWKSVIILYNII